MADTGPMKTSDGRSINDLHLADEIIEKVFYRLGALAGNELSKAQELLDMVKEMAPHSNIDRDLDSLHGLTRKAHLRQRVGHAYLWAIQDIKTVLDLSVNADEFAEAVQNHPTERD